MISYVSDIMVTDYTVFDVLDGLRRIYDLVSDSTQDCFPVMENSKIVGVLTYKDLAKAHPNRIAADAMSKNFLAVSSDMTIWKAKEIFQARHTELLVVLENKQLVGLVTKTLVEAELGKHIDLLTGLYKTEYIYYNALKLIERGQEVVMIFLDVNKFGAIDKKYGHINGDIVLREIGALLKGNMTEQTRLARFGGDEFLMATYMCMEQSQNFARHLVREIACHRFHKNIPVTVSIGIAAGKISNTNAQEVLLNISKLINLASLASTRAKQDKCELRIANSFDVSDIA